MPVQNAQTVPGGLHRQGKKEKKGSKAGVKYDQGPEDSFLNPLVDHGHVDHLK